MATFYLLPARVNLQQSLAELFGRLLPGLPVPDAAWDGVVDRLAAEAGWPTDAYLIPRDDLPDEEPTGEALVAGFGAEPGDRVVEVRGGAARSWVLGPGGVSAPPAAR